MDFSYFVFRQAFFRLKNYMDVANEIRRRSQPLASGVSKSSYAYTSHHGQRYLNLYTPQKRDTSTLPLLIDIHGGCWISGDKDVYDAFNYHVSSRGWNVSTLTYRTADQVQLKDQIQDVFDYLHFLEDQAQALHISLDNVFLTGDSAGAQLALLAVAINQNPKLQEVFEVRPVYLQFRAMALTHPVCYIDKAADISDNPWLNQTVAVPGLLKLLYGRKYHNSLAYMYSSAPERFLPRTSSLPPVLIMTSTADKAFHSQALWLFEFLKRCQHDVRWFNEKDPRAIHVYNVTRPHEPVSQLANDTMLSFFGKHMKKPESKQDKAEARPAADDKK